jgi:hypothetical protein
LGRSARPPLLARQQVDVLAHVAWLRRPLCDKSDNGRVSRENLPLFTRSISDLRMHQLFSRFVR